MKRPMLYWVSMFVLGELLNRVLPTAVIGLMAGIGFVILYGKRRLLAVGFLFLVLGVFCMQNLQQKVGYFNLPEGTEIVFHGIVTGEENSDYGNIYMVNIKELRIGEEVKKYCCKARIETDETLELGSRLEGYGRTEAFSVASNPGGYDEKSYWYGRGVFLQLRDVEVYHRVSLHLPLIRYLDRMKGYLYKVYQTVFNEQEAGLACAMVLGDKTDLDRDIKELYQRNGIAHLIAISGLHIAMIGGTLYHLLKKLIGGYRVPGAAGIVFILLYGMMTGLSGATMRAVIMLSVSIGADISGRRYDGMTAMALALFIMLLNNPYQLTQAGFLLSFGAVIAIAVVNPVWKRLWPNCPKYLDGMFVSVSVQLVLTPVMLYFFYEVPVYSVWINVVVVPMMSLLLALLLVCGILGIIWLPAAALPSVPAKWIFALYEGICRGSERLPCHTLCTGRPGTGWVIGYYGVAVLFLVAVYKKDFCRGRLLIAAGSLYAMLFFVFLVPAKLKICVFDVGQGDGIYIRTPGKHHILMDGGSSSKQKVGRYVLKSGIKYYGGVVLDYVFISHSDKDHYSGIAELLEDNTIEVKNVVLPAISNPDSAYRELERKARVKGCKLYYMKQGDYLKMDGLSFLCLNPLEEEYEDKNTGSLVIKL
ncbi:MAG: DNA internalization-related competence protein ComEC/Rec2, partial [Lachnospiraceae bacterium]|nr:DNA internalization-related competence protein ComEC/Rec2 [Lachnospiraceae bacterium]